MFGNSVISVFRRKGLQKGQESLWAGGRRAIKHLSSLGSPQATQIRSTYGLSVVLCTNSQKGNRHSQTAGRLENFRLHLMQIWKSQCSPQRRAPSSYDT